MKKICFCIKINIPPVKLNYRFFNINRSHNYYNADEMASHVNRICSENILPFLETLKSLSIESGGKFKVAVSISGSTVQQLQKYAPWLIELLFELAQNNYIEFLSEPWANSILPYVNSNLLCKQIVLHDSLLSSAFKKSPEIFIVHSPVCTQKLSQTLIDCNKKGVFSYGNPIGNKITQQKESDSSGFSSNLPLFLINYKLSQVLYEIELSAYEKPVAAISADILKNFKSSLPALDPLVVMYNPSTFNSSFHSKRATVWRQVLMQILNNGALDFTLPSQLVKGKNHLKKEDVWPEKPVSQYTLPDIWLKNKLQKETFKKLLVISSLMQNEKSTRLLYDWNLIQDEGYLFYMNTRFLKDKYTESYFNPFPGPYMAFINYMNVLDDFEGRLSKKRGYYRKSGLKVLTRKKSEKHLLN